MLWDCYAVVVCWVLVILKWQRLLIFGSDHAFCSGSHHLFCPGSLIILSVVVATILSVVVTAILSGSHHPTFRSQRNLLDNLLLTNTFRQPCSTATVYCMGA